MKLNETYKGFKVISIDDLQEHNSKGIWLLHETTGMEIYHISNKDTENLFSFIFKTPPKDSTGVAHILEHSVLCGSEKYPLRDPFMQLNSQSVKTFLNAMTYGDKTVYPASSTVEQDYFNLMSVYGDAVFFPLLTEETFKQEGWRLEKDETGKIGVQGIVYNEMKGGYSTLDNLAYAKNDSIVFRDTIYENDTGGIPNEIPNLTYENFKKFHTDYYNPSNCRLFLYGDISTKKQIDFITDNILYRFSEKGNVAEGIPSIADINVGTARVSFAGPLSETGSKKGIAIMSWLIGDVLDVEQTVAVDFLCSLLLGNDTSILKETLEESGLGESLYIYSGVYSDNRDIYLTVGLNEIPKKKAKKMEKLILKVLSKVATEGVPRETVESVLMNFKLFSKEIRRNGAPFSLELMDMCSKAWLHGDRPDTYLYVQKDLDTLEKKLADDNYIKDLCKKLLLNNKNRTLLTITPSKNFLKKIEKKEDRLVKTLEKKIPVVEKESFIKSISKEDSEEVLKTLPYLDIKKLPFKIEIPKTVEKKVEGIPVYTLEENTNGITYLAIGFPMDKIDVTDYHLIPSYCSLITELGYKDLSWKETIQKQLTVTPSFYATYEHMHDIPGSTDDGRDWILLKTKMLNEKIPEVLSFLFDYIKNVKFTEDERVGNVLLENLNNIKSSIIPSGSYYASAKAGASFSKGAALTELRTGITQLNFLDEIVNTKTEREVLESIEKLHKIILDSGLIVSIVSDKKGTSEVKKELKKYLKDFKAPEQAPLSTLEDILNAYPSLLPKDENEVETINVSAQVGYAGLTTSFRGVLDKKSMHGKVLAKWLRTNTLWHDIRNIGGAYGVHTTGNSFDKNFEFGTYRDPTPEKSLETFFKCVEDVSEKGLTQDTVNKSIVSVYGEFIKPRTPYEKGTLGLGYRLGNYTQKMHDERMKSLLSTTSEDIRKEASALLDNMKKKSIKVIVK